MKYLGKSDTSRQLLLPSVEGGEYTGLVENFSAAFAKGGAVDNASSEASMMSEVMKPLREKMLELGFNNDETIFDGFMGDKDYYDSQVPTGLAADLPSYEDSARGFINFANENEQFKTYLYNQGFDTTNEQNFVNSIRANAINTAQERIEEYNAVTKKQTAAGAFGEFAGSMVSFMTDPGDIASLFIGVSGKAKLLTKIAQASGVNVGVELLEYQDVNDWQKKVTGEEYTATQFLQNAGVITIGTAGLVTTIEGLTKLPIKQYFSAVEKQIQRSLTPKEKMDAIRAFQEGAKEKYNISTNPIKEFEHADNKDAVDELLLSKNYIEEDANSNQHTSKIYKTINAILRDDYSQMSQKQSIKMKAIDDIYELEDKAGVSVKFKPEELTVDTKNYQFKTKPTKLKAKAWDDVASEQLLVYQTADGKFIVVDGHQRLKLAKKFGKDVRAVVIREADGFTPEMAKLAGMVKNAYAKTVADVDFKLYKKYPDLLDVIKVMHPEVLRKQSLLKLGDRGILAIQRGLIDDEAAALIGAKIDNPLQQLRMMDIVREAGIRDLDDTAKMIDDAIANGSLDNLTEESLSPAFRAFAYQSEIDQLGDGAIKQLKEDNAQIKKNQSKIKDKKSETYILNQRRLKANEKSIQLIKEFAKYDSQIADIFNKSAIELRTNPERLGDITARAVDDVRKGLQDGSFERLQSNRDVLYGDAAEKAARGRKALEKFRSDLTKYSDPFTNDAVKADIDNYLAILNSRIDADPRFANKMIRTIDEDGQAVNEMSVKDVMDDIARDEEVIDFINACRMK